MKRFLGIDYGSRYIGIAVSDPLHVIARGVRVIHNTSQALDEIQDVAKEFDVEKIIVGYPLNLKGEKGQKVIEVDEFVERLQQQLPCEIIRVDERFTTTIAQQTMLDMGVKKKQRQKKGVVDAMAAALILQNYLDSFSTFSRQEL